MREMKERVDGRPLLINTAASKIQENLVKIRTIQKYQQILTDQGLNPDDVMTEEQKNLLKDAEYYDKRINEEKMKHSSITK